MIVFGRNLSKLLRILKAVSVVVADPEVTPFWTYFRIGGKNEAAGAAVAAVVRRDFR
jgi:hypothetical protein